MESNRLVIILSSIILALIVVCGIVAVLKIDLTPPDEKGKGPTRTRDFGEGIKISQHGLYGVDLVSIGHVHMRKLRKGPFSIGAINELVLEDVSLALPEEIWREEKKVKGEGEGEGEERQTGPKRMLTRLGVKTANLKLGGKLPRFSALSVRNLRVARLEGTNAVPWFAAEHGEAKREGLALESGYVIEGGVSNAWKEAILYVEPELKLKYRREAGQR